MTATLKTKLHHYQIDITTAAGKQAYKNLVEKIKQDGKAGRGREMHCIHDPKSGQTKGNETEEIEIETAHLFDNQSNTVDGRRVFDWYEGITYNAGHRSDSVRFGHWMEITPEIAELRRAIVACGYCGKQYGPGKDEAPADGFCKACLDSPYLKEKDIPLLRLLPILDSFGGNRAELTDAEKAEIMPQYVDRQTTGADSRAAQKKIKQREAVEKEYRDDIAKATTEHSGKIWILDKGLDIDNVIYYSHTDRFCFGWLSPVSAAVASRLLDIISEFPHRYTIKTEDGRTLENE